MAQSYEYGTRTVYELELLSRRRDLNLSPAFQRQSVWSISDRRRFIESLLEGQPVPSVFLYRNTSGRGGKTRFDVIDGKQRIETLFMFMGVPPYNQDHSFEVRQVTAERAEWVNWRDLDQTARNVIRDTKLQVVEVDWSLAEVIDLFVRINSTGKRLTGAEKRNAKWLNNPVLRASKTLADQYEGYFRHHKVFSAGQVSRMKHVEFMAELLLSLHIGGPLNKKPHLDKLVAGQSINREELAWATAQAKRTLNLIDRAFPKLGQTRLKTGTELYSLALVVHQLDSEGYAFGSQRKNNEAQEILLRFSTGVDAVVESTRRGEGTRPDQRDYLDYLMTIRSDTDSSKQRRKRHQILEQLLAGVFEPKAANRVFSPLQRRILWHSSAAKKCTYPGCTTKLTWETFTVDHKRAHTKGGDTSLDNAQLMCRSHNASKGGR